MKIYIPNQSSQSLGGGFIFISNFTKGLIGKGKLVKHWKDCDAVLIVSATMVEAREIREIKKHKKKIIFRIDNMPKDSRNRGKAFSRMREFSKLSDVIVFQSEWAKNYVGDWLEFNHKIDLKKSHVIYNGIDPQYFYFKDRPIERGETYLYCTYNTDENKRFPEAAYDFYLRNFKAKKESLPLPKLKIIGNFTANLTQYNFDFFNEENITYYPPISDRKRMGDEFRSCKYLYFPAFADASPNTVSEAVACGCEVILTNQIGGTREVIEQYSKRIITIQECTQSYLDLI